MDWYLWAILAVGVLAVLYAWKGKKVKNRTLIGAVGGVVTFGVILMMVGAVSLSGLSSLDLGGDSASLGPQKTISTFTVLLGEKGSNSYTTYASNLLVYDENADPADANANPLVTIDMTSGTGSYTGKLLKTGKNYRVIAHDNQSTQVHYDYDFGVMAFSNDDFNAETGEFTFAPDVQMVAIATILDPIEENAVDGTINGQTNVTAGASVEIQGDASPADGEVLNYDESESDGDFYLKITIGASGANKFLKDAVLCFEHESGASPEGNEMSSVVAQHDSGSNLLGVTDLTNYWKNELCVNMGEIEGGQSEVSKITFTVDEANLDTSDDFKLVLDDLGDNVGKGILFNAGATQASIDFDAQA